MQPVDVAEDDHRLVPGQGGELAGPDVDLEDLAVQGARTVSRSSMILMLSTSLSACTTAARCTSMSSFQAPALILARSASALASDAWRPEW